eukprot:TRINITY_DN13644_c1_g1_i2.p1 TRINITY_DN13644_c1_g1~~TRINITY_DN13644_c1_g1_i2.p1  ORF type:complete len:114 (-),score=4.65 TRINITY_DN13644_c1_g1_i2:853-1194(-)
MVSLAIISHQQIGELFAHVESIACPSFPTQRYNTSYNISLYYNSRGSCWFLAHTNFTGNVRFKPGVSKLSFPFQLTKRSKSLQLVPLGPIQASFFSFLKKQALYCRCDRENST